MSIIYGTLIVIDFVIAIIAFALMSRAVVQAASQMAFVTSVGLFK